VTVIPQKCRFHASRNRLPPMQKQNLHR
jgi:hypothetical protein